MEHKFGELSYQFDTDENCIAEHNPNRFFNGGESDATNVMLEYWKIKPGDIVVDAGAHIGSWTLPALAMGAEHVYCFEPNKDAIKILSRNIELNGWRDRVTTIDKALWHRMENRIFYDVEQSIIKQLPFMTIHQYITECVPLDNYNLEKVDWIKIDTEGSEIGVLIGGRSTIEKCKPKIYVEVHEDILQTVIKGFKAEDIVSWIPWYKTAYDIKTIVRESNGGSFLLNPIPVNYDELKTSWEEKKLGIDDQYS